jgi:hypothetical protein
MARAVGFTGIIVLDVQVAGGSGFAVCVFWCAAHTDRIIPAPNFKSAVPSVAPWSLTAGETSALQAGTVVETVYRSNANTTLANLQTEVQNAWTAAQGALTASAFTSSKLPGAFWDQTTWTLPP